MKFMADDPQPFGASRLDAIELEVGQSLRSSTPNPARSGIHLSKAPVSFSAIAAVTKLMIFTSAFTQWSRSSRWSVFGMRVASIIVSSSIAMLLD
jgi:NADH:ubiquinone oxidoreductase subunit H